MSTYYWRDDELRNPNKYWAAMVAVRGAADRAYRSGDCGELKRLQALIYETHTLGEEFQPTYQQGFCDVTLLLALCLNTSGQFASVHNLCHLVEQIRQHAERKRLDAGGEHLSLGTVLTTLINVLGDSKWQCNVAYRDVVMSPEQLEAHFRNLVTTVLPRAEDRFGRASQRYADCAERLEWAGNSVAKTLMRYLPERLDEFIRFFNSHFGDMLEAPVGAYCYKMLNPESPIAWDFELAKLQHSGTASDEELESVRRRRRETYLKCVPPSDAVIDFDSDNQFARQRGLRLA